MPGPLSPSSPEPSPRLPRLWIWLVVCALLGAGYGVSKLLLQREMLPAFARTPANHYQGFVAIDEYALRGELAHAWMRGEEDARERFLAVQTRGLHPTALLVPLCLGVLAFLIPSIPAAFALLSLLAGLGTALLAGRIVLRVDPRAPPAAATLAAILVLGHVLSLRTAAQLHMDPFCSLWVAGFVLLLLRWREEPGRGVELGMLALLCGAMWIKISLLPLLALPVLVLVLDGRWRDPLYLLRPALVFGALPFVWWLATLWAIDGLHKILDDFRDQAAQFNFTGNYLDRFAIEMLLLFQLFPLVLLLRAPEPRRERALWVALALLLIATWGFRLPPIARLYLPIPALMAAIAVPRLFARFSDRALSIGLAVYLLGNYAAAVLGLLRETGRLPGGG